MNEQTRRVRADFNGLFRGVLCLTHQETAEDEQGDPVEPGDGIVITAFDYDADDNGNPDNIFLMVDADRVRHDSDLIEDGPSP